MRHTDILTSRLSLESISSFGKISKSIIFSSTTSPIVNVTSLLGSISTLTTQESGKIISSENLILASILSVSKFVVLPLEVVVNSIVGATTSLQESGA